LAKGTLKIAEKCGVATDIFLRGQMENGGLAFKHGTVSKQQKCFDNNFYLVFAIGLFDQRIGDGRNYFPQTRESYPCFSIAQNRI
jgi:hypothetical protein